MDCYYNIFIK